MYIEITQVLPAFEPWPNSDEGNRYIDYVDGYIYRENDYPVHEYDTISFREPMDKIIHILKIDKNKKLKNGDKYKYGD